MRTDGAPARRPRAAIALAIAALTSSAACAGLWAPPGSQEAAQMAARSSIEAGLDLYDGGDFELAARRFDDASFHAHRAGDAELVRRATTAECMAWLRARRVEELAECSERLEDAQREARHPDPGVNTLISLGAVAGGRSLPSLRIPTSVRPIIRESAKESR